MIKGLKFSKINFLPFLPAIPLLYFLVLYCYCAVQHITYPFELEWLEGDVAVYSIRILDGEPLYPDPEQGYVPYLYPPFYQYVMAGLFGIFGVELGVGRALSFLASLGTAIFIFLIVYNWTRSKPAGLLAGLFYFAFYKVAGFWYDLVRVDSMAWFLAIATVYLLCKKDRKTWQIALGGVLSILALLTKQSTAVILVGAILFLLITDLSRARLFVLIFVIVLVNSFWLLSHGENSWFAKYYYLIPLKLPVFWKEQGSRLWPELFKNIFLLLVLATGWVTGSVIMKRYRVQLVWLGMFALSTVAALLPFVNIGGYVNNFIPLLCFLSVIIGFSFNMLINLTKTFWKQAGIVICFLIFMLFALKPLGYKLESVLPHPGGKNRGKQLLELVKGTPGSFYFLHHNYYGYKAGKGIFYSVDAIRDLKWAGYPTPQRLKQAITRKQFDYIVLDIPLHAEWVPGDVKSLLQRYYRLKGPIINYDHFRELEPITGCLMKPRYLWVPRE